MPYLMPGEGRRAGARRAATGGEDTGQNLNVTGMNDRLARQQAEKEKEAERITMALRAFREGQELEGWKKIATFRLCLMADKIVQRIEEIREEFRPRTYGEWDERFVLAVKYLPEAREFVEECEINNMIINTEEKKDERRDK